MNTLRRLRAVTLIELFVVVSIICILLGLVLGGVGGCSQSEGSRVGVITKFSRKGIKWKTYEGNMLTGGMDTRTNKSGNYSVPSNWSFTVKDKSFIPQIQEAMDSGHRVKIGYSQKMMVMPWDGDTSYFVTDFKDLDAKESDENSDK